MAQQARPNVTPHVDCLRAHRTAQSSGTVRIPRLNSSSSTDESSAMTFAGRFVMSPGTRSTGTDGLLLVRRRVQGGARLLLAGDADGAATLDVGPVEPALLPDVDVGDEDQPDEHRHLHQPEDTQLPERDRPREQEDG